MNMPKLPVTAFERILNVSKTGFAKASGFLKAHKVASVAIGVAVVASTVIVGTAAVTSKNVPVAMAPVAEKKHTPKQEQTKEVKSASTETPTSNTAEAEATTQNTNKVAAPTPTKAKAVPQPAKVTDKYANDPNPNAIKFIINPQAARLISPIRADGPMSYNFDYTAQLDGSYNGPFIPNVGCYPNPGKIGDVLGNGSSAPGVASLTVNYTAPNGVYSCVMTTDIGYTRFQTRFQIEINEEFMTISSGTQVVPGTRF
jgi:hypothetical protein